MISAGGHDVLVIADAAVFVGLALASVIVLTTLVLVLALSLRSHWERMTRDDDARKQR